MRSVRTRHGDLERHKTLPTNKLLGVPLGEPTREVRGVVDPQVLADDVADTAAAVDEYEELSDDDVPMTDGWTRYIHDESGSYYYYNENTQETVWEAPEGVVRLDVAAAEDHAEHDGGCGVPGEPLPVRDADSEVPTPSARSVALPGMIGSGRSGASPGNTGRTDSSPLQKPGPDVDVSGGATETKAWTSPVATDEHRGSDPQAAVLGAVPKRSLLPPLDVETNGSDGGNDGADGLVDGNAGEGKRDGAGGDGGESDAKALSSSDDEPRRLGKLSRKSTATSMGKSIRSLFGRIGTARTLGTTTPVHAAAGRSQRSTGGDEPGWFFGPDDEDGGMLAGAAKAAREAEEAEKRAAEMRAIMMGQPRKRRTPPKLSRIDTLRTKVGLLPKAKPILSEEDRRRRRQIRHARKAAREARERAKRGETASGQATSGDGGDGGEQEVASSDEGNAGRESGMDDEARAKAGVETTVVDVQVSDKPVGDAKERDRSAVAGEAHAEREGKAEGSDTDRDALPAEGDGEHSVVEVLHGDDLGLDEAKRTRRSSAAHSTASKGNRARRKPGFDASSMDSWNSDSGSEGSDLFLDPTKPVLEAVWENESPEYYKWAIEEVAEKGPEATRGAQFAVAAGKTDDVMVSIFRLNGMSTTQLKARLRAEGNEVRGARNVLIRRITLDTIARNEEKAREDKVAMLTREAHAAEEGHLYHEPTRAERRLQRAHHQEIHGRHQVDLQAPWKKEERRKRRRARKKALAAKKKGVQMGKIKAMCACLGIFLACFMSIADFVLTYTPVIRRCLRRIKGKFMRCIIVEQPGMEAYDSDSSTEWPTWCDVHPWFCRTILLFLTAAFCLSCWFMTYLFFAFPPTLHLLPHRMVATRFNYTMRQSPVPGAEVRMVVPISLYNPNVLFDWQIYELNARGTFIGAPFIRGSVTDVVTPSKGNYTYYIEMSLWDGFERSASILANLQEGCLNGTHSALEMTVTVEAVVAGLIAQIDEDWNYVLSAPELTSEFPFVRLATTVPTEGFARVTCPPEPLTEWVGPLGNTDDSGSAG